jgi:hypothetical protein
VSAPPKTSPCVTVLQCPFPQNDSLISPQLVVKLALKCSSRVGTIPVEQIRGLIYLEV